MPTITHPLDGKPFTREYKDRDGQTAFEIRLSAHTPVGRLVADKTAPVLAVVFWISCLYHAPATWLGYAAACGFGVGGWFIARMFLRMMLVPTTVIRVLRNRIAVTRWYGWQSFDRTLEHTFELIPHDWTNWEVARNHLKIQKAARRGKVILPTYYFYTSFHLVLRHAGQRRTLASFYFEKAALAALNKLTYCDRRQDYKAGMAGGSGEAPGNQWNRAPGGL